MPDLRGCSAARRPSPLRAVASRAQAWSRWLERGGCEIEPGGTCVLTLGREEVRR
jgi:hypothetical protein